MQADLVFIGHTGYFVVLLCFSSNIVSINCFENNYFFNIKSVTVG